MSRPSIFFFRSYKLCLLFLTFYLARNASFYFWGKSTFKTLKAFLYSSRIKCAFAKLILCYSSLTPSFFNFLLTFSSISFDFLSFYSVSTLIVLNCDIISIFCFRVVICISISICFFLSCASASDSEATKWGSYFASSCLSLSIKDITFSFLLAFRFWFCQFLNI